MKHLLNARKSAQTVRDGASPIGLKISYEPLAALRLDPQNARTHSASQLARLRKSLSAFGFITPIIADASGKIASGHARWIAARDLGLAQVPVIRVEHLSAAQLKAFAIADNRLTDLSDWNAQALDEQLKALTVLNLDFSIEATGFELPEIEIRIDTLRDSEPSAADDELPAAGPLVSRPGDLWQLGDHRLVCGDARDTAVFDYLLGSARADMVITDPPYNVPIDGHVSGNGRTRHREFAMASGEMDPAAFGAFLGTITGNLAAYAKPGALHYVCMDWRHIETLIAAIRTNHGALLNICVWVKTNGGMGSLYRSQHELIVVAKYGRGAHTNNIQLGRFGRNRTNVWTYAAPNQAGRVGEEGDLATLHPTVKPVALVADAIRDASRPGQIVLDPFVGSGTIFSAAERTGRRGCGIEIDPAYVDTAVRRWERLTGRAALHANGKTFTALEKLRSRHGTR